MMTQFAPISIGPLSAVRTAPKPIELFGPIVTSPQTTAVGATRADGWMRGATPLWSRSIIASYSSHCTAHCPLSGVKGTWAGAVQMSAFDPKRTSQNLTGRPMTQKTCPDCNGDCVIEKGMDSEQRCPPCGGSGSVPDDNGDNEEVIRTG